MQFEPHSMLNIATNHTPTPTDIVLPEMFLHDEHGLSIANVIECAVSSRHSSKYSIFYS